MLATATFAKEITGTTMQSEASELLIKDLVNSSLDTKSIYSKDYSLKQQFEDIKQCTQKLMDNLDPKMLVQYEVLLKCFKRLDKSLSNYESFKRAYVSYKRRVTSGNVISMECASYLYFLYR